ncbi:MAG: hypothetical protein ACP5NV_02695 [Candidatus Woesearchaeota archaeon]
MIEHSKKRERNNTVLFLIVLALLSSMMLYSITPVLADTQLYNTSRPIIEVNYHEIPVTVLDYNLNDTDGELWPVYNMSKLSGFSSYNFTVDYLSNGEYVFYILARDTDGNEIGAYQPFAIDHGGMNVWLINPKPAISRTEIYNITIGTQFNSICRYGVINPSCNGNSSIPERCRFEQLAHAFQETGNRTTHRIINYDSDLEHKKLYVACRRDGLGINLDDSNSYGDTNFMVGYDLNSPIITSYAATPNPIADWNSKKTTVTLNTNEPTVCKLQGGNRINYTSFYFEDSNPEEYSDYATNHSAEITYYYLSDYTPQNFLYDITCYDRAQWWTMKNLTVRVQFNTTLIISQVTPRYVESTTIDYEVRTNLVAECSLKIGNDSEWRPMTRNTNTNYTYEDLNLEMGDNRLQVRCTSDQTTYANFIVTADNVNPQVNIIALSETCSLDVIEFEMNATDEGSGIDSYWYKIENSTGGLLKNWTETSNKKIRYRHDLEDGETYKISAYVTDNVGLESETATANIVAHSGSSISCDNIKPVVKINVTGGNYVKSIYVTCIDNVECTESFNYELRSTTASCSNSTYPQSMPYLSLPIQLESDSKICVKAYDKNNNSAIAEKIIYVQTVACGNGAIDPGEDCDGAVFGGFECADFGFADGLLKCNAPGTENECQWNTDNCAIGDDGYCGDNEINNYFNEQCDGTGASADWGDISKLNNEGCKQFGFDSGTLKCNPSSLPKGQRCMFNTSQCVKTPANNNPRCDGVSVTSTTLLDSGEQCEIGKTFTLTCDKFNGFDGGELKCMDSCMFDISGCNVSGPVPIISSPNPQCLNNMLEPGEECDGEIRGNLQSFITLLGCERTVQCTNQCEIECSLIGSGSNTCINTIKDGDETGLNCGGSCPSCSSGESCIFNSDCKSGNCENEICAPDTGSEDPIDYEDPDLEEDKPNTIGVILLVAGIIFIIGGLGYIIYKEYFDKSKKHSVSGLGFNYGSSDNDLISSEPIVEQDPKILELQRKKFAEKRQQQQQTRKSLLEGFEKDDDKKGSSGKEDEDDLHKLEKRASSNGKNEDSDDVKNKLDKYVDLEEKKNKEGVEKKGDVFDKLRNLGKMVSGKNDSEDLMNSSDPEKSGSQNNDVSKQSSEKYAEKTSEAASKYSKSKKSKKMKQKSETFEALGGIGKNIEKVPTLSLDIESLTGKSKSSITKMLNSDEITQKQLLSIFGELDRQKITSKEFKNIMSDLESKGKIDKDSLSGLLFNYIETGDATKADVAKILSELKMI